MSITKGELLNDKIKNFKQYLLDNCKNDDARVKIETYDLNPVQILQDMVLKYNTFTDLDATANKILEETGLPSNEHTERIKAYLRCFKDILLS